MKSLIGTAALVFIGLALCGGCDRKPATAAGSPGLATQGQSAEAANTYADANLAELTRELRRWIVRTKQRPGSFEDFVAKSGVTAPTPPAGKKYAISSEMRVVLLNR